MRKVITGVTPIHSQPRISVVINTLNEERNLPYCLRSVRPWADEIVVVDMHSADRTVAIAKEFGAHVFSHEPLGYADPARAFAVSKATGDWILILDADELVPAPLSRKLRAIADAGSADVVNIPRLNYLIGAPMMHTGWGPEQDRQPRFFRQGMLRFENTVHDFITPVPGARLVPLTYASGMALVHFNYLDIAQFIEKLNRYTDVEARQIVAYGWRLFPLRALAHGVLTFVGRYVRPAGYRDGWRGVYLALFMSFYRVISYAKATQYSKVGSREAIIEQYRQEAERVLGEYDLPEETGPDTPSL